MNPPNVNQSDKVRPLLEDANGAVANALQFLNNPAQDNDADATRDVIGFISTAYLKLNEAYRLLNGTK